MRIKFFLSVALAAAWTYSFAQTTDVRAAIEAEYGVRNAVVRYDTKAGMMDNTALMGGEYCMYPFEESRLTPAPKGYKPVYISYIGRHGARFCVPDGIYETLRKVLSDAHAAGKLTVSGENLYARYERFYPYVAHRGGDLTRKGQEQLRKIAAGMYRDFPEVFKGKTKAEALSTPVPRVLLSMMSFVGELKGLDKDFDCSVDAGRIFSPILEPDGVRNPYRVTTGISDEAKASLSSMRDSLVDPKVFCSRFFNDIDFLEAEYGTWPFESDLRSLVVSLRCLDVEPSDRFDDIFTPEELFNIWELRNYSGYLYMGRSPLTDSSGCLKSAAILENVIESADRDLASGEVRLSLRFSHDTAILPLLSYMCLDNFGAVVGDPADVKNWWRSDKIPMASNLQLVFYRSRHTSEILVKVLYNGREASLPIPRSHPSFYSWAAFKDWYKN